MNKLPKDSHDADFSRIKPWYLDGQYAFPLRSIWLLIQKMCGTTSAAYLRQSILFSAYETPETRSLFNQSLKNVAGKMRTVRHWSPVKVPEDLDQV